MDGTGKAPEEGCLQDRAQRECGDAPSSSGEEAPELHGCLETIVGTLLEAVVTLSGNHNATKAAASATSRSRVGEASSGRNGGKQDEPTARDESVQSVIVDALRLAAQALCPAHVACLFLTWLVLCAKMLTNSVVCAVSLIHMVINAGECLGPGHRNAVVKCIFQSPVCGRHQESHQESGSATTNVEALIQQLLMANHDESVRKQTMATLFDAVVMGWDAQRSCDVKVCINVGKSDFQGFKPAKQGS